MTRANQSTTFFATLLFLGGAVGAAHGAEVLKVGTIAPLTGPAAAWGAAIKMAAEILADDVNAKGGLDVDGKNYTVKIIPYDDQYKPAEGLAAYNRLVNQDGVKYVLVVASGSTLAIKKNAEDDKVVVLTSGIAPAIIDDQTKFIFRLNSVTSDFMPGYAKWVGDNLQVKKIACLNPNDDTGWSQAKATTENFKKNGLEVVSAEMYERTTKDFAPILTKVIDASPDIIDVGVSSPASAAGIIRQARDLGYKGRFMSTGGAGWSGIVDAIGKEAAEGLVNLLYADPANPAFKELVAKYTKVVGQPPNDNIVSYYDAFDILLHAIQRAGDPNDTEKVVRAIPQVLPFKSLQGDEITQGKQQFLTPNYVAVLTDGKPVVKGRIK